VVPVALAVRSVLDFAVLAASRPGRSWSRSIGRPIGIAGPRASPRRADADIERELPLDEPVEVAFTPSEAGELRLSCGMDVHDQRKLAVLRERGGVTPQGAREPTVVWRQAVASRLGRGTAVR